MELLIEGQKEDSYGGIIFVRVNDGILFCRSDHVFECSKRTRRGGDSQRISRISSFAPLYTKGEEMLKSGLELMTTVMGLSPFIVKDKGAERRFFHI